MGVKWVRESDKYSVKTESRRGCMQYSFAESSNISKFMCGIIKSLCAESSRLLFLINVTYRSDANLINGHRPIFGR